MEQAWLGREFRIGSAVLRASAPCVRCAYISLAHEPDLAFDKRVGGAVSQLAEGHLGIYCDVIQEGELQVGSVVSLQG
ncbi:hypothetical protein BH10PSE7_BH10PSE7_31590 [soil metagenome]